MAMYFVSERSSIAPTNVRGAFSLYAIASTIGRVREVGWWNTTATAARSALARFSATGTQGTAYTEGKYDPNSPAADMTAFQGHTADATVAELVRVYPMGGAIGAGVIYTFGGPGLIIDEGTGNGVGVTCPSGTGQIIDFNIDWEE